MLVDALVSLVVTVTTPPPIVIVCIITILEATITIGEAAGVKMSLLIITYPLVLVFILLITSIRLICVYVYAETTSIKVTDPKLVVGIRVLLFIYDPLKPDCIVKLTNPKFRKFNKVTILDKVGFSSEDEGNSLELVVSNKLD